MLLSSSRLGLFRCFSSITKTPKCAFKPEEFEFIVNPHQKYIQKFMELHGNERGDLSIDDFETWKNVYGEDYKLYFIGRKDSDDVAYTCHFIRYRHLTNPNKDFKLWGMAWAQEKYRGREIMIMQSNGVRKVIDFDNENVMVIGRPSSFNGVALTSKRPLGHLYSKYICYYDPKSIQNPKLKFDGIYVKKPDTEEMLNDVVKYDQTLFPYERSKYMKSFFTSKKGWGRVAYDDQGNVIGIGAMIKFPLGEFVLTPLYCESSNVAQAIFQDMLDEISLENAWRIQFRGNSINKESLTWMRPFCKTTPVFVDLSSAFYLREKPDGLNMSKVFQNTLPTNCII